MSVIVGAKNGRGGRWKADPRVSWDGVVMRADQCRHAWLKLGDGNERCQLCPATCHRGEDGKIDSYLSGFAPPVKQVEKAEVRR